MSRRPAASHRVHGPTLWRIIDAHRSARSLSWRAVARETGTSASLFTKLQLNDSSLHADALVSLLAWLGMAEEIAPILQAADSVTPKEQP